MIVIPDTSVLLGRKEMSLFYRLMRQDDKQFVPYNTSYELEEIQEVIGEQARIAEYFSRRGTIILNGVKKQVNYYAEQLRENIAHRDFIYTLSAFNGRLPEAMYEKNEQTYRLLKHSFLPGFQQKGILCVNPPLHELPDVAEFLRSFADHYMLNKDQKEDHGVDHSLFTTSVIEALATGKPTMLVTNDRELATHVLLLRHVVERMRPVFESNGSYCLPEKLPTVYRWSDAAADPTPWLPELCEDRIFKHRGMGVPNQLSSSEDQLAYRKHTVAGATLFLQGVGLLSRTCVHAKSNY